MGGRGQGGPGANHRAGAPPTCNTDLSAAQNGIVQEELCSSGQGKAVEGANSGERGASFAGLLIQFDIFVPSDVFPTFV